MEEKVLHPQESSASMGGAKKKEEILWSGVLQKRGHLRKNWLTRFFVLTPTHLRYYKKPRSPHISSTWNTDKRYLRGELRLADLIHVESSGADHRPYCFVATFVRQANVLWLYHAHSTIDYHIQANSDDDRDKWIRLLTSQRGPKFHASVSSSSSMKLAGGSSSSMICLAPSAPRDIYLYMVGHCSDDLPGDAVASAKVLAEEFPIFVALIRELDGGDDEHVLVHVLDQMVGEVLDGAWNETVKKVLALAAEQKLATASTLWTDAVKTAYMVIMKAMHKQSASSSSRQLKSTFVHGPRLHRQPSSATFASTYSLGRILGSGAHSVVRVGWHHQQLKQVAVKCIAKAKLLRHEQTSLLQEVAILRQLRHPNIVPLLDFVEEVDMYYIVTPLCTGGELFQDLVKRTQYTEDDARHVLLKLAHAVAYIHAQNIMHRDIKPENVLLFSSAPGAEIMLADFGFARMSLGNHLGTACGTPEYIAPEVVKGIKYGIAVDCWSLGVLLFILLSGQPPFPGHNHADILARVAVGAYSMDAAPWVQVSNAAKALVRRLLTVDPSQRLTADALLHDPWMLGCNTAGTDGGDDEGKRDVTQLGSALEEMRLWRASGGSSGQLSQADDLDDTLLDDELAKPVAN
ncbi:CAMK protein kinase [Saprolegnia diclina VS20]|uniref:CAMK protein kinase n=1 Tax=Saprolegnia diclina (strain VS20) TaxID=1156394 RepID=T0RF14_SAPDV|nr:CAMK protein kinase [Saprolegnia diclina VS20]EQC28247.1 CAMK protein kinase [Saprolegnia diclina VS20]|eukprot:XP_008618396.1 CAMK protein kinase [Saprolegnia diclina VS20]